GVARFRGAAAQARDRERHVVAARSCGGGGLHFGGVHGDRQRRGGRAGEERRAGVQRVDRRGDRRGDRVEFGLEGRQRAGRARQREQRADLGARRARQRLRPVDRGAFHQRFGGVAEGDRVGAVGLLGDGHLRERRKFVDQQVAAVEHVV